MLDCLEKGFGGGQVGWGGEKGSSRPGGARNPQEGPIYGGRGSGVSSSLVGTL